MIEVYDFFSGCGGTSSGLQSAGLEVVLGLDAEEAAVSSFHRNFPKANVLLKDIRRVGEADLKPVMKRKKPALFCGCAPCQPFSRQNASQRTTADPRSSLLQEFERFVRYYKPEYVLVENVPGLQQVQTGDGPLQLFKNSIESLGYYYTEGIVAARSFGVPQRRERYILLGSLSKNVTMPCVTHGPERERYTTVRDFIFDLPAISAGETDLVDQQHTAARLSALNLARIAATPEGGGREAWPPYLSVPCHAGHMGHSDVYGRLSWDKPAASLTTRCTSYSNGRFGHPVQNRALSIREAACLQTFGREFQFCGTFEARSKQIGNAVPPAMAAALGQALLTHL